jgi:hypothetical protein
VTLQLRDRCLEVVNLGAERSDLAVLAREL